MHDLTRTEVVFSPPIDPLIDQFLCSVGFGFNPAAMKRAIRAEALRLNAKSDAELWQIGLTRDQIPAHVMRHRLAPLAA